jgi:hypothetical protein
LFVYAQYDLYYLLPSEETPVTSINNIARNALYSIFRESGGHDHMVVGFITTITCAISV